MTSVAFGVLPPAFERWLEAQRAASVAPRAVGVRDRGAGLGQERLTSENRQPLTVLPIDAQRSSMICSRPRRRARARLGSARQAPAVEPARDTESDPAQRLNERVGGIELDGERVLHRCADVVTRQLGRRGQRWERDSDVVHVV